MISSRGLPELYEGKDTVLYQKMVARSDATHLTRTCGPSSSQPRVKLGKSSSVVMDSLQNFNVRSKLQVELMALSSISKG